MRATACKSYSATSIPSWLHIAGSVLNCLQFKALPLFRAERARHQILLKRKGFPDSKRNKEKGSIAFFSHGGMMGKD